MYIREMVKTGSRMTLSPLARVSTVGRGCVASYCSAIRGEMLHLKKPTPVPKKMRPMIKAAIELCFVSTVYSQIPSEPCIPIWILNYCRNGSDDDDNVAKGRDTDCDIDRLIASPVSVRNISTYAVCL